MWNLLFLAIGGALGTLARYGLNELISNHQTRQFGFPAIFPLGTMVINVTGCLVIGLIASVSDPSLGRIWLKTEWRNFLIVGLCGGYTTFSSYGLQTFNLARDGEWYYVGANVIASNGLGFLAVYLGWICGRWLQAKP